MFAASIDRPGQVAGRPPNLNAVPALTVLSRVTIGKRETPREPAKDGVDLWSEITKLLVRSRINRPLRPGRRLAPRKFA
jgi:hypothetical protein